MTYFFYLTVSFCLIIFQTSILPNFLSADKFFDLLIPFIFYIGFFHPFTKCLPIILFFGFVMDNLSGAPFGLYMTTYFWLFVCEKKIIKYMHAGSIVVFTLFVFAGVLIENCIFTFTIAMLDQDWQFLTSSFKTFAAQTVWAACASPFFLIFIRYIHRKWNNLFYVLSAEKRHGG